MKRIYLAAAALLLSTQVVAHHAFTGYDTENLRTIEGEITEILWRNPHVSVTIERLLESGEREVWQARGEALNSVLRAGVERSDMAVGDHVALFGAVSLREPNSMAVYTMTVPSGRQLTLWPRRVVQLGLEVVDVPIAGVAREQSVLEARGIYRVWSRETGGTWETYAPVTDAAVAARTDFDSLTDDPALSCIPPGMPSIMDNPFPVEFVDAGDRILIRLEMWDRERTIYLSEESSRAGQPASPLGYSTGRWDGNTLIVTTTRINDRYFDWVGTPLTEEIEVVERFTLNNENDQLDYSAVITDPATFAEPATVRGSWYWVPGEVVKPYECAVGDE